MSLIIGPCCFSTSSTTDNERNPSDAISSDNGTQKAQGPDSCKFTKYRRMLTRTTQKDGGFDDRKEEKKTRCLPSGCPPPPRGGKKVEEEEKGREVCAALSVSVSFSFRAFVAWMK
ncbi:hypothetical protein B296_00047850, partial [Ensete ventricosum]